MSAESWLTPGGDGYLAYYTGGELCFPGLILRTAGQLWGRAQKVQEEGITTAEELAG